MNTKEFVKALRAVIREEVRSAVREELKSVLIESKSQKQIQQVRQQPKQPRQQVRSLTGNSILDQVLNETRLTPEFRQSADVGFEDFGSFTSNNVQSNQAQPSLMDMDIVDDYESPLPEPNSTMPFMKDYTQLMKKADQISTQKQF